MTKPFASRNVENRVKLERKVMGLSSGCKQFRIALNGDKGGGGGGQRFVLTIFNIRIQLLFQLGLEGRITLHNVADFYVDENSHKRLRSIFTY
jgi:hypothetical protein